MIPIGGPRLSESVLRLARATTGESEGDWCELTGDTISDSGGDPEDVLGSASDEDCGAAAAAAPIPCFCKFSLSIASLSATSW